MRFERLDILRYGALTDRCLAFRPDANLHVIYGPNEAGKSSALSAISDLLFGFPDRTPYGFQSDAATLRIGASIASRSGARVEFRRRKGRKSTLLAATDAEEALPDDALTPFLGTLSRDVFERAFGLNSLSLRAGGESMLKSGGEIGSLLFSAASGLTGLMDLRKELEGEADSIYAPRRSKDRLFYQVLDAHEEARRAERESELKSGDWKKLQSEQAEVAGELEQVSAERQEVKRALERLRRLQRLDPIIREIDREQNQLGAYVALAGLSADFEARLASLQERLRENGEARRRVDSELARLRDEIASVHVDEPLLAASAAIMAALADKGVYQKAREDIARVRGEVEDFDQRLAQAARRLGISASADLETLQPPDAELARLRALVEEGATLDRRLQDVRQRLEEQHEALRRLRGEADSRRVVDPKPWAEQLAALQPDLADLQRAETLQVRLARAQADLAAAVSRLDPPVADLRRLAAAPLPELAELSSHRRLIEEARAEARNAALRAADVEEQAAAVDRQLAALEGAGRIVSRDDLLASRRDRDAVLDGLRRTPDPAGFDRLASAIGHADRMADSALADAERVTRHAELTLRRNELQRAVDEAGRMAREAEIALSDAVTDYEDGFRASGIRPTAPERMIEWRRAVAELFRQLREIDGLQDEFDALRLKEEAIRPALLSLADAVGLAAVALPTVAIGRGLGRRLAEIAQDWMDSRSGETKRAMAEEAIAELEEREQALLGEVTRWRSPFSAAAAAVGLPEDADPAMALAALEAWRTVPGILSERQNRQRRVRGMTRDMEAFEEAVGRLVGVVAADLAGVPADVAAGLLHERMLAAAAESNRRQSLAGQLKRAEVSLARLIAEDNELAGEAEEMAAHLSVQPGDLPQVVEDLRERHRLETGLRQCRERFAEQAEGASEDEIRTELVGFDKVAAGLEIERLVAEEDRLIERMNALGIAKADSERRRRELEAGIGAERAVFRKLAAEAEAKDLARRWVVLKLAASLLSSSMEAYRERQADPVMKRAGELFSGLTGGRFARLLQLYDERDELQLAVERRTGEQVPLSGLSEGTGDQLYLALRLAFLEDYCRRNEPAPLVLDDIFQTFDDERTATGLRTLATAGEMHQTLLFTHHTSVVDAAKRELGDRVDVVQL
ncbi:DNA recombination protein RecF [Pseudorhizobium endolithicum]|uniref:DNA recombination protein RecF n=1 Tax=Pseudorhizobium endolithicum TaxID=1191678 RepID=A0ABN7JIF2_9HYPH|nr:YhaN family protein [Pseudorhizobium endolithicum]CAD7032903.1 DNA recombination protein RecF [Pseudorhizobium endolithicum]